MPTGGVLGAAVALALLAAPGFAQRATDPDWPCIQRKVPELTAAQMWAGPPPTPDAAEDPAIAEAASRLTQRRVPVEEVAAQSQALVEGLSPPDRAARLAGLFNAILTRINRERGQIIAGIGRYARRQTELSDGIEAMQLELAELESAPAETRDQARIDELNARLPWDIRVFRERAQALTYVCETPILLERRAFEIGRALAGLI